MLKTLLDPWDAQFAFIWYNDDEIFRYTPADFDRKAARYAARGINIVITFSCTHFRWSFWDYHGQINRAIAMLVEACHKYDIRVVEHHSALLSFDPLNDADFDYAARVLSRRHSSLQTWPEMTKHWRSDRLIKGISINSMRQIDGRTGGLARSVYHGWIMCPNNADFRREYLRYLESVYALGVDGIMTDDLHFMGGGHACACETCRRLFSEQTGYELPAFGEAWKKWHGSHDAPSFVAWKSFKYRAIEDFHKAVAEHYKGLGLKLLRPNYHSNSLNQNPTSYRLETLPELHWVATECCFSNIIRYAWGFWACETAHKLMMARVRNIPAGAYFYPDRPDTMLFTWAISKAYGAQWIPTPEGSDAPEKALETEAELRKFERNHAPLYRKPQRIATLGIFDSRRSRELYEHYNARSFHSIMSWLHTCLRRNVPFDILCEQELHGRLAGYRTVVLNEVAFLSDAQISRFAEFVKKGGNLVWLGRTGENNYDGGDRPENNLRKLLGLENFENGDDGASPKEYRLGQGKIATAGYDYGINAICDTFGADRWTVPPSARKFKVDNKKLRKAFDDITDLLGKIQGPCDIIAEELPEDVLISIFHQPECDYITLHIVNAAGTAEFQPEDVISHSDKIPFPPVAVCVTILLKKFQPQMKRVFEKAVYHDPVQKTSHELAIEQDDNAIAIHLPAGTIREYGLVELN